MEKTPNNLLRHAREERGWSQSRLAEELGVEEQTVRSWERGTRFPSPRFRNRLCEVFGMTLEQLGLQRSQESPQSIDLPRDSSSPATIGTIDHDISPHPKRVFSHKQIDKNRKSMLKRVRSTWIDGVLEHSLHHAVFIALGLQEQPDALADPWRLQIQEIDKAPHPLPKGTHITQVYDEADGELLILGEPGAGKTTLLLELARDLLDRAEQDEKQHIPVIFNLSSWATNQQSLDEWLIEELFTKYRVPSKIGKEWIKTNQLIILLDGLDEVNEAVRSTCVQTINAYQKIDDFVSVVVCCRRREYFKQETRVALQQAVLLQPLTIEQVNDYLSSAGKQLKEVQKTFEEDVELYEIVKTPLMLDIVTLVYQGGVHPPTLFTTDSLEMRRQQIFAVYVQRMLSRRGTITHYTQKQTIQYLAWLAQEMQQHNQTEFYIERMQPDWIGNGRQLHHYQRTVIRIVMIIQCLVSGALAAWLKGGLKNGVVGSGNGILGLFGGGPGNSMMGWMSPGIGGGSQGGASLIIILGIVIWLVTILVGSPSLPLISPQAIWHGLLSGLLAGLKLGMIISILGIPFFAALGGLKHGILYGLGIGFFLGILVGLMHGLDTGLRYEQQPPKEIASFSDRLIDGLILGICAGLGFMVVELLLQVNHRSTLIYSSIVVLFFFFAYGFGGGTSLFSSLAKTIKPAEAVTWSWTHMSQALRENSMKSLIVALVTGISVSVVVASMSSLFFLNIDYGLHYGLVFGTISGLIVGIAAILTSMLKSGWSSTMLPEDQHTKPNEGISRSGRNALLGACFFAPIGGIASGLACAIGFGLVGQLSTWPIMGMAFALMLTIMFFVVFATAHGGIAWIEHYTLRGYLWHTGSIPMNYVRFLNSTSEYALIQKVGGGYMFTHRLMLEHFASIYKSSHNDLS
jgi:transcriptional regulator with XRE-family HTH domain